MESPHCLKEGIEWPFLLPARLIQSASLLGPWRTGLSLKELFRTVTLTPLASLLAPADSTDRLPQPTQLPIPRSRGFHRTSGTIGRPTPRRASLPISLSLIGSLTQYHSGPQQGLPGSRISLPHRAVRKHLGTRSGRDRLRHHSAGSTLPPLWPTGSSSGQPPSTTARCFSSSPPDSRSRATPCPPSSLKASEALPPLLDMTLLVRAPEGL